MADRTGRRVGSSLSERFRARAAELGLDVGGGPPVLVAVSGGLDSCVLLHLMRFTLATRPSLLAVHFDHGMRVGSADDAAWVSGLCRAWDVPVRVGRATRALSSEEDARSARYGFFDDVRLEAGADRVLTAHHADDQAETVLFRILRGTGLGGLRGIPVTRPPGIVRPLLGSWRDELEAYAEAHRVGWRNDPSNADHGFARNAIRRHLLPDAESMVSPGARRALVRLADLASADESAWAEVMPRLLTEVDARPETSPEGSPRGFSLAREAVVALGGALRGRVFRHLGHELGCSLDASATARAIDFASAARSGTRIELGAGVELLRELDRLKLTAPGSTVRACSADDRAVVIERAGTGSAQATLGGQRVDIRWSSSPAAPVRGSEQETFGFNPADFPLTVRGRVDGDRIRLAGGLRKVKKLLLEARIPSDRRGTVAVLEDRAGRIVWIPGVARSAEVGREPRAEPFTIYVAPVEGVRS